MSDDKPPSLTFQEQAQSDLAGIAAEIEAAAGKVDKIGARCTDLAARPLLRVAEELGVIARSLPPIGQQARAK